MIALRIVLMPKYGGTAQTAATHYFTTDNLGSTRMILNGTGGCVERLDYAPFGGQISRSGQDCYGGASSEKPLFTGKMRDGESTAGTDTGQDYFNARYFWANTARFTSPDAPFADQRPADGQSWNMYAYVRNNPLRYVDPTGLAYQICAPNQPCITLDPNDQQFEEWQQANPNRAFINGKIFSRNDSGTIGAQLGNFFYVHDP